MKKTLLAVMLGLLLIGVTAFGAGDLGVMGTIGVGTSPDNWGIHMVLPSGKTTAYFFEAPNANQSLIGRYDSAGANIFQQRTFSDTLAPRFVGVRGRGDLTTKGNLLNGDTLYEIYGKGWAQNEGHTGGQISFEATENWTYDSHGTQFSFYTSPNGQATYSNPIERLRITEAGNVEVLSGDIKVAGYVQLDLTSGAPLAADCNASTRGRMIVDSSAEFLYICVDSGWVSK